MYEIVQTMAVTPYMTSEEVHLERAMQYRADGVKEYILHTAVFVLSSRTTRVLCDDAVVSSDWHADQTQATLLAVDVFG